MRKFIIGALLSSIVIFPSSAADLIIDEPMVLTDAGFDWSGFYAGITGGYGTSKVDSVATLSTTTVHPQGALLGVNLGVNWQIDQFVLGAEGDIMWSGMTGSTTCPSVPAYACGAELNWIGTVRGKAGFAADRALIYATGGLAVAGGKGTISPTFPGTTSNFSDTWVGWTIGAGAELAMTDTLSVKAEYNYLDLGSRTAPVGTLTTVGDSKVSPIAHVFKLGVNMHF